MSALTLHIPEMPASSGIRGPAADAPTRARTAATRHLRTPGPCHLALALGVMPVLVLLLVAVLAPLPCRADEGAKPLRKPGVSFLLSTILPGAGQLYNGDDRGYVFLGIEAVAWFARFSYLDAGNRKETEFERYADNHWTLKEYRGSSGIFGCNWTAENDSLIVWFEAHNQQQYYEEVGKYDKFRCGWDDFAATYDPANDRALSPNRARYRKLRLQSNDLLDRARLALAGMMVNRIVSGVDAFRTARGRVRGTGESSLRLESGFRGGSEPMATLALVKVLP